MNRSNKNSDSLLEKKIKERKKKKEGSFVLIFALFIKGEKQGMWKEMKDEKKIKRV